MSFGVARFFGLVLIYLIGVLAAMLFLTSCATPRVYEFKDISKSLLVPKTGFKTLTSGRCAKWKTHDVCETYEDRSIDLADPVVREVLRSSSFICKVGSKRFLICKDQPGLCHYRVECKSRFLGMCTKKEEIREYIAQDETEKLKGFGTVCFNEDVYPYFEI